MHRLFDHVQKKKVRLQVQWVIKPFRITETAWAQDSFLCCPLVMAELMLLLISNTHNFFMKGKAHKTKNNKMMTAMK